MDQPTLTLVLGALATTITGMAGFIVYLIKYVLADKDKQIRELKEDRDEWANIAITSTRASEILAAPVAEQAKRPRASAR